MEAAFPKMYQNAHVAFFRIAATHPVSSTFPPREEPEMRDSRIEETSEAAGKQVRKRAHAL